MDRRQGHRVLLRQRVRRVSHAGRRGAGGGAVQGRSAEGRRPAEPRQLRTRARQG